jgi:thymidylate synthase (FAD)
MKTVLLTFTKLEELQTVFPKIGWRKLLPHLNYTISIEEISRACSHQLVRHRIASFSQQSQRYLNIKRLDEKVVIPPNIRTNENFTKLIEQVSITYRKLVENGVPKEDARFVLPNATMTSLLMTIEGESLIHFIGLRTCNRAQWEIKEIADRILIQLRQAEPIIFNQAGPYCYQLGYCPEGRYTCGRIKEVLEKYKSIRV